MNTSPISFGSYRSPLKSYYKKGFLDVTWGIYGERLNKKTVSLEHLLPKALGGKNILSNYALADRFINEQRGTKPLSLYVTPQNAIKYIAQFIGIKLPNFDGNEYVKGIIETLRELKIFT